LGALSAVDADVEKSPAGDLQLLVDHPAGSEGAATVSNVSINGKDAVWAPRNACVKQLRIAE